MPIIIALFMNFIVILGSFLITYKIFKKLDFVDSLLCWFILYFAQIIFTELLLGILGILYLKNVILINLVILFIIWLTIKGRTYHFNLSGVKDSVPRFLENKIILFGISLILSFGLVKVFSNLANPPFGWDNLNYHFTFPVEWMKHGNLNNPLVVSDDPFPTYYPISGSLLFLWLMFPFKNAFLADIGQLPFFVISFLAILSISRKLNLNQEHSFLAASLFVIIPNFFKQLQIAYVDIMLGGIFLVALNFLLGLTKKYSFKDAFLFSLAFGILVGIKTTALAYGIFLLIPFFYLIFSRKEMGLRLKCRYLVVLFLMIFIFGGFSYFKNFLLTQNPFYPLDVSILGKAILKGVIDKATFTARNIGSDYSLGKILFHEGLGVQSLIIILPAVILAPFISVFRNKEKNFLINYVMLLPLLLYLVFRFILPLPNTRYLYPMLGTGMVCGLYILSSLKVPHKPIRIIAFVMMIVSALECARHIELGISLGITFLLFIIFSHLLKYKRLRNILFSKGVIISSIFISLIISQMLLLDYKKNEYIRYVKNSRYWPDATRAWLWLNNNSEGNNIAYVGRPVPYPLYGTGFKNNVYYVSVNSLDPIHLHDLKNSRYSWDCNAENMHRSFEEPNNYRGNADYSAWLDNLNKRKTEYLFIYTLHHTKKAEFPIEEEWARSNPAEFKQVFNNETIKIYKLS